MKKVWRDLPLQDIHGSRQKSWSGICGVCLHLGVKWNIIQSVSVRGTQLDWDGVISHCFPHKCVFFSKLVGSNSSFCDSFCFDMFTHWLGFEAWYLVCRKRQRHPTQIHYVIMSHETPGVKGSRWSGWHPPGLRHFWMVSHGGSKSCGTFVTSKKAKAKTKHS